MDVPETAAAAKPPIGKYLADLAKLLEEHPAPWRRVDMTGAIHVEDAGGAHVDSWLPMYGLLVDGLVASINIAAGIRP